MFIFLKNKFCWYLSELPQWGNSNDYPQYTFLSWNIMRIHKICFHWELRKILCDAMIFVIKQRYLSEELLMIGSHNICCCFSFFFFFFSFFFGGGVVVVKKWEYLSRYCSYLNWAMTSESPDLTTLNPCHAEQIKMPRLFLIFNQSDNLIQTVAINSLA